MTSGCRETETDSAAAPDDEATTEDEEDGPAEAAEDELAAEGAEGPAEGAVASSTSMMKLFGYPERVLDGSGPRDFGIHKIVPIRKNSVNTEINVVVCSVLCSSAQCTPAAVWMHERAELTQRADVVNKTYTNLT